MPMISVNSMAIRTELSEIVVQIDAVRRARYGAKQSMIVVTTP